MLGAEEATENIEQVEQYRALCLLALGRADEAELSLERLVTRRPLYLIPEAEVSPRLVALFRDVRRRALPGAAREAYRKAKASYDAKDLEAAVAGFEELLKIVADSDADQETGSLGELRDLADGFLTLARGAQAPAPATPAPQPTPPPPAPPVYTAADTAVTPPVEIDRRLPAWIPPTSSLARTAYRGVLEIVINELGAVESATLLQSVNTYYDVELLRTARIWRFRPAVKDGEPVPYRKAIEIFLRPQSSEK
jgi:TonB family protein